MAIPQSQHDILDEQSTPLVYKTQPPKTLAQKVCAVGGFAFLLIGILGFGAPRLLGAHLMPLHNVIHLVSGLLALWFALASPLVAKRFCLIFGAIYGFLGLLGFIAGQVGVHSMPDYEEDPFLFTLIPRTLELGKNDHILHLIIGAIFIGAAILTDRASKKYIGSID